MSNVHGFGSIDSNNRIHRPHPGPPPGPPGAPNEDEGGLGNFMQGFAGESIQEQLRLAQYHRVLFVSGQRSVKNPREENYYDMLVFGLCPNFSFFSITFLIIIADVAMFIWQLTTGFDKASNNLLQVKTQALIDTGAIYAPGIRNGQVYRLLSAIFLHINFLHIFGNVLVTFLFLSRVEYTLGPLRALIIYVLSGIGANIFSIVIKNEGVKAGASTSLYGIIGVIIGYIILNWNGLDLMGPVIKCQVYCSAIMIIVFIFIFTPSNGGGDVDYYGHLGGFLSGLWLAGLHKTIIPGKCQLITRIVFLLIFALQLLFFFLGFYVWSK